MKRRLDVPNATRWNSIYDFVEVLNIVLDDNKAALYEIMKKYKIQAFTDQDISVLNEY